MRRSIRNLVLAGLAAMSMGAGPPPKPAYEPYTHPQRLVRLPDGRRINLYCLGRGGPTVILDAGWNGSTWSWSDVQPRLARSRRVCSFDRAGLGFSDPGPLPRDTLAAVRDLRAALAAARIRGPYVLVGHSAGALDMRLFASLYPKDAVGLVLVDPASEHQDRRLGGNSEAVLARLRACAEADAAGRLVPGTPEDARCVGEVRASLPEPLRAAILAMRRKPGFQRTLASEYENLATRDSDQIDAHRHAFGDLPLIVLTAKRTGQDPSLSPEQQAQASGLWRQLHAEVAALSRRGEARVVAGSGHLIQVEKPQAVVDAVDEVVGRGKRR